MDPLSIASGCVGLVQAIGSLSFSIHAFVRTCREARSDLDRVSRELVSLQTVLELIQEDVTDDATTFPQTLERHVSGIVLNCNSVVTEIQECITKYSSDNRLKIKASWAINGQGDVAKLRSSLEAHKAALELALDMFALHVTKDIKNDTTEIRNDTAAIKEDTAQILAEIARLQERLPKQVENDYILQHFLEEMTTYTEQTLDRPYSDGRSPSLTFLLPDFDSPDDVYLEDSKRTAVSRPESPWNQLNESQQSLPTTELTVQPSISSPQYIQGHGTSSDNEGLQGIGLAPTDNYTPKPTEEEVCLSYYDGTTLGRTLVINCPVTAFIHENLRDQDCYESTHTRFTAVACNPQGLEQLRYPFRPRLFAKPRHTAIVFVLDVTSKTTYETFVKKWNFAATAISQARRKVEVLRESLPQDYFLPWQHTIILVHFPSKHHRIPPEVRDFMIGLGVQHHDDDLMRMIGRTSFNPPLPEDQMQWFLENIAATIHEYTVQPAANLHRPTIGLPGTEPLQVISVTDAGYSFYIPPSYVSPWVSAICTALDTRFIVQLPDEISIESPGNFFWEMWTCQQRFKTSQDAQVNKLVVTTPEEFLREHKRLLSRYDGPGGYLKRLFSRG
ncbi:hypothetical protein DER45DRAFT_571095 [Fusarium avenaceum]|nr:hypothetical protein DER45DRAFT_571095 [Fusarium avenaceum]